MEGHENHNCSQQRLPCNKKKADITVSTRPVIYKWMTMENLNNKSRKVTNANAFLQVWGDFHRMVQGPPLPLNRGGRRIVWQVPKLCKSYGKPHRLLWRLLASLTNTLYVVFLFNVSLIFSGTISPSDRLWLTSLFWLRTCSIREGLAGRSPMAPRRCLFTDTGLSSELSWLAQEKDKNKL